MIRFSLLWILLTCIFFKCEAQATFQKTFGEQNYDDLGVGTFLTSDGGCIVIGRGNNLNSIYAIKLDSTGSMKWTRIYGQYIYARTVKRTNDDGFIICGSTDDLHMYLLRCDSSGDTLWTRTFITTGDAIAVDIAVRDDGDFIIYGKNYSNENELIVFRLSAAGNIIWSRTLTYPWVIEERHIGIYSDGSILINGNLDDTAVIVTKLTSSGSFLWCKEYHCPEKLNNILFNVTPDGDCILSGYLSNPDFPRPLYILSLDQAGNPIWCKQYHGQKGNFLYAVTKTEAGNFFATGLQNDTTDLAGDILVVCFDQNGDTIFTNVIGRTGYYEWSESVCETQEGGFYISGSEFFPTNWVYDIYLAKTDDHGRTGCQDKTSGINTISTLNLQVSTLIPSIITSTMSTAFNPVVTDTGVSGNSVCSSIGVKEINTNRVLHIFPNPSGGIFNITFSENNPYTNLSIFNSHGEVISQKEIGGEESLEINLTGHIPGIYLFRFENTEQYQTARLLLLN